MTNRYAAAVAAIGLAATSALAQPFNFVIQPQQEVPPNNTNAAGSAQLLYNTINDTFNLNVMVFGITIPSITGYHIHNAPFGVNGPVVIDLQPLAGWQVSGQGIELQINNASIGAFEAALFAGNLYFNLHTTAFPGGQIRGQITPSPAGVGVLAAAGVLAFRRRRQPSTAQKAPSL